MRTASKHLQLWLVTRVKFEPVNVYDYCGCLYHDRCAVNRCRSFDNSGRTCIATLWCEIFKGSVIISKLSVLNFLLVLWRYINQPILKISVKHTQHSVQAPLFNNKFYVWKLDRNFSRNETVEGQRGKVCSKPWLYAYNFVVVKRLSMFLFPLDPGNHVVVFWVFFNISLPKTRLKATLGKGLQERKNI